MIIDQMTTLAGIFWHGRHPVISLDAVDPGIEFHGLFDQFQHKLLQIGVVCFGKASDENSSRATVMKKNNRFIIGLSDLSLFVIKRNPRHIGLHF